MAAFYYFQIWSVETSRIYGSYKNLLRIIYAFDLPPALLLHTAALFSIFKNTGILSNVTGIFTVSPGPYTTSVSQSFQPLPFGKYTLRTLVPASRTGATNSRSPYMYSSSVSQHTGSAYISHRHGTPRLRNSILHLPPRTQKSLHVITLTNPSLSSVAVIWGNSGRILFSTSTITC